MKVQAYLISLLLLTIVSNGESRSLDGQSQCALNCKAQTSFDYQVGSSYNYQYQSNMHSSFFENPESTQQYSQVSVNATFEVSVLAPCEHSLQIKQIELNHLDQPGLDTNEWAESLLRNPMRFSWQDGRIESVCAVNSDEKWVLNIKRAMLSGLQVSAMDNVDAVLETDITGTCESSYNIEYIKDGLQEVRKSKDFSSCKDHNNMMLFSHFTPYASASQQQMLMQEQECTQTISNKIVSGTVCSERHVFRPFSSDVDGARALIHTTIDLIDQTTNDYELDFNSDLRRTSLSFEKEAPIGNQQDTTEIRAFFQQLCEDLSSFSYQKVGEDFIEMVFLLRRLDGSAVEQAYDSLEGACVGRAEVVKSMFEDALKWCGSEGCVQFGTKLIARGSFDDSTSLKWLLGMNTITEATSSMVDGLMDVLQSGRFPEQSYLVTGSIINGICSDNQNCLQDSTVSSAIRFFEDKLGENCESTSDENQQEILLALRALGNAGRTTNVNKLASCAKNQQLDGEVRIAAIQAFRRTPCGTSRALEEMVFDREEDSEFRIGAYATIMRCPNSNFMSNLVVMLDDEPSQQVSSYVSTHLRSLISSTDPLKGYLRPYLIEAEFAKTYDLDPRKFSRHVEMSHFSDVLNAGVTAEGDLVWSPKSFVPRSAALNLTVDIFGQAVNLFEIGGRVEGVENLLQDMMKKKRFIQNSGIGSIFGKDVNLFEEDDEETPEETVEEVSRRLSRSTSESKVSQKTEEYQSNVNKDQFGASWYVRVFGNELKYGNSRFPDVYEQINQEVSSIVMDIAKGKVVKYHDDVMIINSANTIPTMIGFPLTIAINGSANIDVQGEGSMDLSSLLSINPELAMNAEFYPRATVQFTTSWEFDAHVTRGGIKTQSVAETSTKISGRAALTRNNKLSLRVDTPLHGANIVSFEHKLLKIIGEMEQEPVMDGASDYECHDVFLAERLCTVAPTSGISVFPKSGLFEYRAYFEPGPQNVDYYQLDMSYDFVKDDQVVPALLMARATFDSSDVTGRHRHHFLFNLDRDAGMVTSQLAYPNGDGEATDMVLEGEYSNTGNDHQVTVDITSNGEKTRLMKTLFANNLDEEVPKVAFYSSMSVAGFEPELALEAAYSPSQVVSFDASLANVLDRPIEFKAGLGAEMVKNKYTFRGNLLAVVPDFYEDGIEVEMNIKPRPDNYVVAISYTQKDQEPQSMKFAYRLTQEDDLQTIMFMLKTTQFPALNAQLDASNRVDDMGYEAEATLSYGENFDERSNDKFIKISQSFNRAGSSEDQTQLAANIAILAPHLSISEAVSGRVAIDDSTIDASVRYNDDDFFQVYVKDQSRESGLLSKTLNVMIPTPWETLTFNNRIQEIRTDVYKLDGSVRFGSQASMSFTSSGLVENLDSRKSLSLDIGDGDRQDLLSLRSEHALLEPFGFSSNNSVEGRYFGRALANLFHQEIDSQNFETHAQFDYDTMLHYKADVMSAFSEQNSDFSVKVEYKNGYGQPISHYTLTTHHSTVPEGSEDGHLDASFSLTTNALPDFSGFEASLGYRSLSPSFAVINSYHFNQVEVLSLQVDYNNDQPETHMVRLGLGQQLTSSFPQSTSGSVSVTNSDSEKQISFSYLDQLRIELTVTDEMRGTIQNNINSDFPEQSEILFQLPAHGFVAKLTADRQVLNFRAHQQESRLLLNLDNSFEILSMVPQRIVYDLNWGEKSGQTGTWSTLQVDSTQATFEAMCGTSQCNLSFNPGTLTLSYLPVDQTQIPSVDASMQWDARSFSSEVSLDSKPVFSAEFLMDSTMQVNMMQDMCEYLPSKITLNGRVDDGHKYELVFDFDNTHTLMSLDMERTFDPITAHVDAVYFSNCSLIAGNYSFSFDLLAANENFKASVHSNQGDASLNLSWMLRDIVVEFEQNILVADDLTPQSIGLRITTPEGEQQQLYLNANYNSYMVRFFYDSQIAPKAMTVSYRLQQNIFDTYRDVSLVTTTEETDYTYSYESKLRVDDQPEQNIKYTFKYGLPEDNHLTWGFEASQNYYQELDQVPNELSFMVSIPDEEGNKWTVSMNSEFPVASNEITFVVSVEGLEDSWVISHEHSNGFIASLIGRDQFAYKYVTTATLEGLSMRCDLTLDEDSQYNFAAGITVEGDEKYVTISSDVDTNIFEVLPQFSGYRIPKKLSAVTKVGTGSDENLSGRVYLNSQLTRVYPDGETLNNFIDLAFGVQLFNWNLEFSGKHDLQLDFLPSDFKYELVASGSTEGAAVLYKSVSLSVMIDGDRQSVTVTMNRNSADQSMYFMSSHNITQLLKYGVPSNMSVSFVPKGDYNFDLNIVYDTQKKSIGFDFEHISESNKLKVMLYHGFDYLTELGIPMQMGVEGQYQLTENDFFAELQTTFGETVRDCDFTLRWDGNSFSELTSVTYRHNQNFLAPEYMPNVLRIKLQRAFDNSEMSVRFAIDEIELRVQLGLESSDGEYSPSLYISQNIVGGKVFPKRLRISSNFNTIDNLYEMKVKAGSDTLFEVNAEYMNDEGERQITATISQMFFENISPEMTFAVTNVLTSNDFSLGLDVEYDEETAFKIEFNSGVDAEENQMFVELRHNQDNWESLGFVKNLRLDAQLFTGDSYEVTARLLRGDIENAASFSFNWNVARDDSVTVSAALSHDVSEIIEFVPASVQGRFYGEYSPSGVMASLNATVNDESFAHTAQLHGSLTGRGYTAGASFMHTNRFLTDLNVPNSVGFNMVGDYSEEGVASGSFMVNYGEQSVTAHAQAGPGTKADLSFTVRSDSADYDGEVEFAASTDQVDFKMVLNGDAVASMDGKFSLDQITLSMMQKFESERMPSDIELAYKYNGDKDFDLSAEVVIYGESTKFVFGFKPTSNGNIASLTINNKEVKEFITEYSINDGSLSLSVEQNLFSNPAPKSSVFSINFDGDSENPQVTAALTLDDVTKTLSARANMKSFSFSLEHDLPLPWVPQSLNGNYGYVQESGRFSNRLSINVDDVSMAAAVTVYLEDTKGAEVSFRHNLPVNMPMDMTMKLTYNVQPNKAVVDVATSVDGVERSMGVDLDMNANVYIFKQNIPELSAILPGTCKLAYEVSYEPFDVSISLTSDENESVVSLATNDGSVRFVQSVAFLEEYIPTAFEFKADGTSATTWNGMIKMTISRNDYQVIGKMNALEQEVEIDLKINSHYANMTGKLMSDDWYGAAMTFVHNIDFFEFVSAADTLSIFSFKFRSIQAQAVVKGFGLDYDVEVGFDNSDSMSLTATFDLKHDFYTVPQTIEDGRFEFTISPSDQMARVTMTAQVDRQPVEFSADFSTKREGFTAQMSLTSRDVNMRASADATIDYGSLSISGLNQYQDRRSYRDDRVSLKIETEDKMLLALVTDIKELKALDIPTSYKFEFDQSDGKFVITTGYDDTEVKLTATWNQSSRGDDVLKLSLDQNIVEPNQVNVEFYTDYTQEFRAVVGASEIFDTELYLSMERIMYRLEMSDGSFETIAYIQNGINMKMSNTLFDQLPKSAEFQVTIDRELTSTLTIDEREVLNFYVNSNQMQINVDSDAAQAQIEGRVLDQGAELNAVINRDLNFDAMITITDTNAKLTMSLDGETAEYNFDESFSMTSKYDDEQTDFRMQMASSLVSFDVFGRYSSDPRFELALPYDNLNMVVNMTSSKLLYSQHGPDNSVAGIYGMELNEQQEAVVYAGSANKVYTVTADKEDDTMTLKVVEKSAALSIDVATLKYTWRRNSGDSFLAGVGVMVRNLFNSEARVELAGGEEFSMSVSHFGFNSYFSIGLNLTLSDYAPAGSAFLKIWEEEILASSFKFSNNTQHGYDLNALFKMQLASWQESILVALDHDFASHATSVSTSASLRVNNMPPTSFAATVSNDVTDSSFNYSFVGSLRNGALSDYVKFRTLDVVAWQQEESSGRKLFPSCSYTAMVDGEEYHLSYDSQVSSSAKTSRFDIDLHMRHPFDFDVMGMTFPKQHDIGFNMLKRRKGIRMSVDYNSEQLSNPVKVTKQFKMGRDGVSFEGQLNVVRLMAEPAEPENLMEVVYSWQQDVSTWTFNVQYPYSKVNFESMFKVINTAEEAGFEALIVDFKEEGSSNSQSVRITYSYEDQSVLIKIDQTGQEPIAIRAQLNQLASTASDVIQQLMTQSAVFDNEFIYGREELSDGERFYFGIKNNEGQSFTLNLQTQVEETGASVEVFASDFSDEITQICRVGFSIIDGHVAQLTMSANPMFASSVEDILMIVEGVFNKKTEWISNNIIDLINALSTVVSGSSAFEDQMSGFIAMVVQELTNLQRESRDMMAATVDSITGFLENGEISIESKVKNAIVSLMEMVASANNILLQPFDQFVDHFYGELVQEINSVFTAVLTPLGDALDVINAKDLFFEVVDEAVKKMTSYLNVNGDELFVAVRGPMSDLVLVTETEIVITVPLSFQLDDVNFAAAPSNDQVFDWFSKSSFYEKIEQMMPQMFAYFDYYYQAKAVMNTPFSEQLPPFKGHALVADFRSFRTFDGHHYDFTSDCESSHVLVTDGSNGNFTILINYGETPSYDIRIGADENVMIAADGTVVYNQHNAILPVTSESGLNINQMGDFVKLMYHDDITVTFDTKTRMLALQINPFYFAATGGMLGVFDNEPNYDYVTPQGSRVADVMDFVKSWEVSESLCASRNMVAYSESSSRCEALFMENNSPFRSCFPVIPTQPFMEMCSLDKADFCKIAKSYKYTCQLAGVALSMPDECMQCVDSTGSVFNVGETTSVQTGSVDVVMVIQETSCLRSRSKPLGKFLRKFLKQTSATYRAKDLSDTQFYVVGYGGPGSKSEPHSFTMRGKLSSSKKSDISKVIRKIDLSEEGTESDGVAAIDFATKLSFRPGAQQVIVHISCDQCADSSLTSEVAENLRSQNIAFHHMPMNAIDIYGYDGKVYGYNRDLAYSKKSKTVGGSWLKEDEVDICSPLAINSGGSVWNGLEMKSNDLVSSLTGFMGENATPGGSRTCTCEVNSEGSLTSRCSNN